MRGFRLVNDARIGRFAGRPDISVVYSPTPDGLPATDGSALAVTLDSTEQVIRLAPHTLRAWRRRAATPGAWP
jgi:hypothetical protein